MNLRVMSCGELVHPNLESSCHDVSDVCLLAVVYARHNNLHSLPGFRCHCFSSVRLLSAGGSAPISPILASAHAPSSPRNSSGLSPLHRFRLDHSLRASLPACSTFLR